MKNDGSMRMCIDYKELNKVTMKNLYPLLRIEDLLDQFSGVRVFSKIDLWSGYHQVRVKHEDIPKMAIRTQYGHYEFLVMSFASTNAPVVFMEIMNRIFDDYLDYIAIVLINNIFIYYKGQEDHEVHLKALERLRREKLYAKLEKCEFWLDSVSFLGHMISEEWVFIEPEKAAQWSNREPTNVHEIQKSLYSQVVFDDLIRDYRNCQHLWQPSQGRIPVMNRPMLVKNASKNWRSGL